jgi:hypothetical protein
MTERRYNDDEVRKIFGLATTDVSKPAVPSTTTDGLTLAEIQNIGLEVGLQPDAVARAATSLDAAPPHSLRTTWGMPVEVARTVPLPRTITDHEWEQLVGELRTTFRASGKITTHGSLRQWRNGNLHVSVEPTERGARLRMGTVKGNATAVNVLGAAGVVASTVTFGSLAYWGLPASFGDAALYVLPVALGGGGIGAILANWLRLPRWAAQRDQQMTHIAARLRSIMGLQQTD